VNFQVERRMRVLVLGSGAREHALCWAIAKSAQVRELTCAPGNAGIALDAQIAPLDLSDPAAAVGLARRLRADLVVVGPEDPLAAGVVDRLAEAGVLAFGPTAAAARIESSKAFAKQLMRDARVPTARHRLFDDPEAAARYARQRSGPLVVKADGLTAGKGVTVCDGPEQAVRAIEEAMRGERFGAAGARVLLEERLFGPELSYFALCDGTRIRGLGFAQDFKRAHDGDRGENTGGMGAYSPVPLVDEALEREIQRRIVEPVVAALARAGTPYRGVLYCGLILHEGSPHVIEWNARFGDPETQALLFRLEEDLVPWLLAAAEGRLDRMPADALRLGDPAVFVVIASPGYPRDYPRDLPIAGLEAAASEPDVKLFHAATRLKDGVWRTAGGRVIGVAARGKTLKEARARAYAALSHISFPGAHYRRDIAAAAAGET
jgi:phosphoribosylamine--glycine ligase